MGEDLVRGTLIRSRASFRRYYHVCGERAGFEMSAIPRAHTESTTMSILDSADDKVMARSKGVLSVLLSLHLELLDQGLSHQGLGQHPAVLVEV